ncbi:unnamed protein product [Albugo candida]|uniref:Uncharacterized protein n=1 Tax=Albugo candida TaxID=65357 RepID=A0A024FTH4_9STRA|nr:unnamed protein product [Albugo candida]|eukprot:CCI10222.1 unnamed protein product [Albugo candida]
MTCWLKFIAIRNELKLFLCIFCIIFNDAELIFECQFRPLLHALGLPIGYSRYFVASRRRERISMYPNLKRIMLGFWYIYQEDNEMVKCLQDALIKGRKSGSIILTTKSGYFEVERSSGHLKRYA